MEKILCAGCPRKESNTAYLISQVLPYWSCFEENDWIDSLSPSSWFLLLLLELLLLSLSRDCCCSPPLPRTLSTFDKKWKSCQYVDLWLVKCHFVFFLNTKCKTNIFRAYQPVGQHRLQPLLASYQLTDNKTGVIY